MSEPAFYIFSSSGGCQACDALGGLYLKKPRRPHGNCQCTITPYYPENSGSESGGSTCKYDEHLLLYINTDGSGTEWNGEEGQYDRLVINVQFSVMCKDGSIQDGEYIYEEDVQSDRFPYSNNGDLETYGEMVLDSALEQWEDEADEICPGCV